MQTSFRPLSRFTLVALLLMAGCRSSEPDSGSDVIAAADVAMPSALTSDGVEIFGEPHFGDLTRDAPLILLFHQGGSSARGEYPEIGAWLNDLGYRALAWDQRSGGDRHGVANRAVDSLAARTARTGMTMPATDYCSAYADLEAALEYVALNGLADRVIVWGSSYSASLVFRLAVDHPDQIAGLLAFSPAAGGPLVNCRARMWVADLAVPAVAFRPQSEMENTSAVEQRQLLEAAGVAFHVIENGVHGSSMLLDSRTDHDMAGAREIVAEALRAIVATT